MPIKFEDLKVEFEKRGFKWQELHDVTKAVGVFYKLIVTTRPCLSNNNNQLSVFLYRHEGRFNPPQNMWTCKVDIVGQTSSDVWFDLNAYSIDADEIFEKLPSIEAALIRAWEALV
jgi:hypothetical protein